MAPDQAFDAVQEVVLVDVQLSVTDPPEVIEIGPSLLLAFILTEGPFTTGAFITYRPSVTDPRISVEDPPEGIQTFVSFRLPC